jgi:hypothetical protein
MPRDLVQVPLDQPTVEPAAATSGPARGRTPGIRHGDRGRPSALVGWLLVAIAGLGMFISSPPSAGPDEPAQETTAWYLSGHGLRPGSIEWFSVPVSFSVDPCFKEKADVSASCMPPRSTAEVMVSTSMVLSYAPPYYWVVGIGERLAAALVGIEYAGVGGRLASFILNFGALLLLSLYMRRRNQWWGNFLLLVSTPMAVFMGVVVNPSGWEITCGLVMAAVLSEAVWSRRSLASDDWPKTTTLILVIASVALCLTRPLGLVWASGLTVSAIALAPSIHRRLLLRVACAVAPGIALGMLWALICPVSSPAIQSGAVASAPPLANYPAWFALSLLYFPLRLEQMFGVLGWLDTAPPMLLFLTTIVAWSTLLIRLPSIRKAAVLCGVFGIVILPSAIEMSGWASWPVWWQGRYTLPFALGFGLLLLLRSGHLIPRTISIVSGISLLSLGLMIWVNAARYDFGLNVYDLPASLGQQGLSPVRLFLSLAVGALLLLVSGYLLVRAWKMRRDLRPPLEPETLSAPLSPIGTP